MNFIKQFILLLFYVIITTDCSPYNHLDIQLALLILSADDHNNIFIIYIFIKYNFFYYL